MNPARFDSLLTQVLVLPTLALLVGAALLLFQMHAANETVTQMQSAGQARADITRIEQLMDDQETGLRGYQITGNTTFLDPYRAAEPQMTRSFYRLRAAIEHAGVEAPAGVTEDEDRQIDKLEAACIDWNARFAKPLIAAIQAGGNTHDVQLNLAGKAIFDGIRGRLDRLDRSLGTERDAEIERWQQQTRRLSIALIAVALMLGLLIGLYMRRRLKEVSAAFRQSATALELRAAQIARSELRLRTTLDSMADGVITCDAQGGVEAMNTMAEKLTGWPLSEACGKNLNTLFTLRHDTTQATLEDTVTRVNRLDRAIGPGQHAVMVRRDGSELAVEDRATPLRDASGAIVSVVTVLRDVTAERRAQAALLANEKLATAGRLAATIAHEIHNPLDSVSNLLFLMDGPSTPEETVHFLAMAREEITRVTQISRAMLSLYRESRAPVAVDVKEMLESILLLLARRFAELGVETETALPDGLIVAGFPAELRQVFTNLLTNAAEACSPRGETYQAWQAANPELAAAAEQPPLINVRARACPPGVDRQGLPRQGGVEVQIVDEGPGIPDAVGAQLFQPFFTTKGERGTGLGLWVSRGIMTKHGGSVDFDDRIGPGEHGTVFTVFLPATTVPLS